MRLTVDLINPTVGTTHDLDVRLNGAAAFATRCHMAASPPLVPSTRTPITCPLALRRISNDARDTAGVSDDCTASRTADATVLYDGGKGQGQGVPIPAVKTTIKTFAARDGCEARPVVDRPAPSVERETYPKCANGDAVALISLIGANHPWAGGLQAKALEPNVPAARYSASAAILDFFDAQRGK